MSRQPRDGGRQARGGNAGRAPGQGRNQVRPVRGYSKRRNQQALEKATVRQPAPKPGKGCAFSPLPVIAAVLAVLAAGRGVRRVLPAATGGHGSE